MEIATIECSSMVDSEQWDRCAEGLRGDVAKSRLEVFALDHFWQRNGHQQKDEQEGADQSCRDLQ